MNRGDETLINLASGRAVRQVERTNVRAGVAKRRVGLAAILSMAIAAFVLASAGSAFATSVPSPFILAVTNYTASDTGVTYSVAFTSPHALTKGSSTITLQAPAGTKLANCEAAKKKNVCKVLDESASPIKTGTVTESSLTHAGANETITVPVSIGKGDRVGIHIPKVTNSSTAGQHNLVISTSADTTGVSHVLDLGPQVLISQVRPNGPTGAEDSFVELYAGGLPVDLNGWTLKSLSGGAPTTIATFGAQSINANGLEPDGYLLAAGSGYAADTALNGYATPDVTLSGPIPTTGAVALYDNTGALVDSASFGSGIAGAEFNGALGSYSNSGEEYAFVRRLSSQPGYRTGTPQYTGRNASDFTLVAPEANPFGSPSPAGSGSALTPAFEGAPAPHDLDSAALQEQNVTVSLLKGENANAEPNLQLVKVSSSPNTSETIYLRRTITYTGQCALANIRLRVSEITTDSNPAPAGSQAILRVLSNEESGFTFAKHTYTLAPTILDNPPSSGADGGGLNSSVSLPDTEIKKGKSIDVAIKLGVQRTGNYRFFFDIEGSPAGYCS